MEGGKLSLNYRTKKFQIGNIVNQNKKSGLKSSDYVGSKQIFCKFEFGRLRRIRRNPKILASIRTNPNPIIVGPDFFYASIFKPLWPFDLSFLHCCMILLLTTEELTHNLHGIDLQVFQWWKMCFLWLSLFIWVKSL